MAAMALAFSHGTIGMPAAGSALRQTPVPGNPCVPSADVHIGVHW
ncbi:hypothetical protein AAHB37_09245 [Glutamicibacter halophytocola]|nr:hypothetical protein [Glutamicibacter halophytocola]